jgi:hypothetical protein
MKKIILTAIGLAMLATPVAAENTHASGYAPHELHRHGIDPRSAFPQRQVTAPQRFFVAPAGSRSFGLTLGTNLSAPRSPMSGVDRPYGGQGVPYSTPPQGWNVNR